MRWCYIRFAGTSDQLQARFGSRLLCIRSARVSCAPSDGRAYARRSRGQAFDRDRPAVGKARRFLSTNEARYGRETWGGGACGAFRRCEALEGVLCQAGMRPSSSTSKARAYFACRLARCALCFVNLLSRRGISRGKAYGCWWDRRIHYSEANGFGPIRLKRGFYVERKPGQHRRRYRAENYKSPEIFFTKPDRHFPNRGKSSAF